MTSWIDSHCHVYDPKFTETHGGVDAFIEVARGAGVEQMIAVGCDRATSRAAIDLADRFDSVHATVGLHPHEARHGVDTIVDLLDRPGVIAVGECGLDYHYDHSPRHDQRRAFAAQIALANERAMPLVIHTREAWDETFEILDAEGVPGRTIFHCFTGGPAEARSCLGRGAFVSFSGIVTFPSASDVRDAVKVVPPDRTLVETDSPYLAPVPHRGRTNQPAFVPLVGAAVADLRGVAVERVAEQTVTTTRAAFGLLR